MRSILIALGAALAVVAGRRVAEAPLSTLLAASRASPRNTAT